MLARARRYLVDHGRFTITAVTAFERLRGYRAALLVGKPFEAQLRQFEGLLATCVVLALDQDAAERAAIIWGGLSTRRRAAIGDILIAGIAASRRLPIATRNAQDFDPIATADGTLTLVDWSG